MAETSTDMESWRWQARTIFRFMGCPCDKILLVAEYWGVAGCSPGQSSLAAVPAGFYHIYAFVICLLGLTPCALNGLPYHGIQVQSPKKKKINVFICTLYIQCLCVSLPACRIKVKVKVKVKVTVRGHNAQESSTSPYFEG